MDFGHLELEAFPDLPNNDMQVWTLDESSRLEGGYILKYINNELPFMNDLLCAKANHLLFNLTCAGLHEKTDRPHVTDEEEEAQGEHTLNHCVTLPPAEHLLSARLLENTGV